MLASSLLAVSILALGAASAPITPTTPFASVVNEPAPTVVNEPAPTTFAPVVNEPAPTVVNEPAPTTTFAPVVVNEPALTVVNEPAPTTTFAPVVNEPAPPQSDIGLPGPCFKFWAPPNLPFDNYFNYKQYENKTVASLSFQLNTYDAATDTEDLYCNYLSDYNKHVERQGRDAEKKHDPWTLPCGPGPEASITFSGGPADGSGNEYDGRVNVEHVTLKNGAGNVIARWTNHLQCADDGHACNILPTSGTCGNVAA
ncbi:hypothetical protein HKX48_004156 [Thoreauomyces humboldtii]|nr:hypothetical protein HKX48_004156 [Thoreauomyces humboldtii]